MDVAQVILTLVIVFALAKGASYVFARFGMPGLIGEIILGIILANLVIGDFNVMEALGLHDAVVGDNTPTHIILEIFSELGVIFLLFTVGLETKVKDLTSVGRTAMLVALLGVIVPFLVGYAYIMLVEDNLYHAMFLGAAMVATSVGITARVIKDLDLLDARESRGTSFSACVSGMAKTGELDLMNIVTIAVIAVVFVVAIILIAAKFVPALYNKVEERNQAKLTADPNYLRPRPNMLIAAIIACLGFAYLAELIGLAGIIGAFLAGMLFAEHAWEWKLEEKFESITTLFVSFFFVYVGMKVDLQAFIETPALLGTAAIVIVLACITKYVGCGLGAKISERDMPMSSYNVIVLMCIATTLIAPPILSRLYQKKYKTQYTVTPEDRL